MKMIINFEGIPIKHVHALFIILKKIDLNNNDNSLHIFVEYVVPLSDNETPVCVLINMEFFSR